MNVLLAVPTGGNPAAPFLDSLRELHMPEFVTGFDRLTVAGNFVPGQRELAARRATATDADALVMFDDDMILPPDALERLLGALAADAQLAVVGGLYYSRDGLHPMVADHWDSRDTTSAAIPAFDRSLTACDAVGFGCVAIRVSALRSMPEPYFHTQVYVEEHAARVRICNEDYLFCEAVRHAGWRVALHAGVRAKHYDRASSTAFPREWEDAATTRIERMLVVEHGPSYRMIPYGRPCASGTVSRSSITSSSTKRTARLERVRVTGGCRADATRSASRH
jgi:GT2 family glycosyltransferase